MEGILDFDGEHIRMSRGSEGIPLQVALRFHSLTLGFVVPHFA